MHRTEDKDKQVKSYKFRRLKRDLPKNAVIYVYNKDTDSVDGYVTDRNGKPKPFSESEINLGDIVYEGDNLIEIVNGKLRVKKLKSSDNYIKIEEEDDFIVFSLTDTLLEKIPNKQNDLTEDGTGTKYPTVDAVNTKFQDVENTIGDIETDITILSPEEWSFSNATSVNIPHGRDMYVEVTVLIGGEEVFANVSQPDKNNVVVNFSNQRSGKVIIR